MRYFLPLRVELVKIERISLAAPDQHAANALIWGTNERPNQTLL
jgi:hypothetical protein